MSASMNPTISTFTVAKRQRSKVAEGIVVVETWVGPVSGIDAFMASYAFGAAHGTYSESFLTQISEEPYSGTGLSTGATSVVLTYAPIGYKTAGFVSGLSPGEFTIEVDSNMIEQPIEKMPQTAATSGLTSSQWAEIVAEYKQNGVEAYLIPAPIFIHTKSDNASGFTITEADAIGVSGKVAKPTSLAALGLTSATAERWLWTGKQFTFSGGVVQTRTTAQYTPDVWDPLGSYIYEEEP